MASLLEFNFSTTYYLEIIRSPQTKVYESEWFVNDFSHQFEKITLSDADLISDELQGTIEFNIVNRN
jgi:hypothetical protein